MKKILSLAFVASFAISLFAADIFEYVPLKGNPKNYTKIEYSIAYKFGNYFRTPKVKYLHVYDEEGKETESSELTPRDVVQNTISSVYDDNGNLIEQKFVNADGELIWKTTFSYKDGFKVLKTIAVLFKEYKPRVFFGILGTLLLIISLILGIPVLGNIPVHQIRFVIASVLFLLTLMMYLSGIVLGVVAKNNKKQYELLMNLMKK